MSRKDARRDDPQSRTWKSFATAFGSGLGIVVLLLVARTVWGPGSANADTPSKRSATASSGRGGNVRTANANAKGSNPANAPTAGPTAADIVASVNGQHITRDELAHECMRRFAKDVLENIVNRQLILQACQQRKITITNQDVEEEVDNIASKFGLSKDRWIQLLQEEREVSPDQYRKEIVWPTLALRRLANDEITVSQQELQKAFESEYGPSVKVRLISLDTKEEADKVRAQAVAAPDSFGNLAKEFSKDPNSASARGLIPPIRKHLGEQEVEKVAFGLKKGEISPVIFAANQYLILKCEEQLDGKYIDSKQIEMVKAQLSERIRDEKMRESAAALFRRLQDEAKVVNVLNDPALRNQHPGAAALINGRAITMDQLGQECLDRHGKDVLEGEINRLILTQELKRRNKIVEDRDIDEEIARAAETYGYLKDGAADVEGWLKAVSEDSKVTVDLYVRDAVWPSVALKKIAGESVKVTDEDLQKGFESNYGERVEVMAIVLDNQRQAQKVWEMARNDMTDQGFGDLAQQYSIEAMSRSNAGRVPPIRKHGGQQIIEDEAFRLKPGELSGILALTDKYVILRCLGRTKPVVQDFNAVKDELSRDIHEKKLRVEMAKAFDSLRENARIDNRLAGTFQAPTKGNPTATAKAAGRQAAVGKSSSLPAGARQPAGERQGANRR